MLCFSAVDGHLGFSLEYLCLKVRQAKLPGHRYPVMAIDDEIGLFDFHDLDRWQGL